jgi:hypothetical protein
MSGAGAASLGDQARGYSWGDRPLRVDAPWNGLKIPQKPNDAPFAIYEKYIPGRCGRCRSGQIDDLLACGAEGAHPRNKTVACIHACAGCLPSELNRCLVANRPKQPKCILNIRTKQCAPHDGEAWVGTRLEHLATASSMEPQSAAEAYASTQHFLMEHPNVDMWQLRNMSKGNQGKPNMPKASGGIVGERAVPMKNSSDASMYSAAESPFSMLR